MKAVGIISMLEDDAIVPEKFASLEVNISEHACDNCYGNCDCYDCVEYD